MAIFKRKPKPNKTIKNYKNRKWIGVLCLAAACLIAFVVLPYLYEQKNEVATVVVATSRIEKGSTIKNDQIELKEIGIYGLEQNYFTEKSDVLDTMATSEILPGDIITDLRVGEQGKDIISSMVSEGKRLVTITVASNAAGVASHIQAGDTVDVYSIKEDDYGYIAVSLPPGLKGLKVYDTENVNTVSTADTKKDASGSSDAVISTTTLIVTEQQAQELIAAEYAGKLHLAFINR